MKNKKPTEKALELNENYNIGKIKSDVTGSYTGCSEEFDRPIQDQDDL